MAAADATQNHRALTALLAAAGYAPAEPPILQPAAIFLEVSGEELRRRLYLTSDPSGEELCLRPDLTIPTVRLHLASGEASRPARYSYLGPVFRFREDGPSEFLQAGAESFGCEDPIAEEAATLALAFEAAALLGLPDPLVRLGDVGLLDALVSALDLSPAWRRALHRDISRERPLGAGMLAGMLDGAPSNLSPLLRLGAADAQVIVREMLSMSGVEESGGRTLDEIAERFLEQAGYSAGARLPTEIRQIVEAFLRIAGSPADVAHQVRALARDADVQMTAAVDLFEDRLHQFAARGIDCGRMHAATGFGRNLDYYTGLVFEFVDPRRPQLGQLVGGGRYDRLLGALGAPGEVRAVGFSLWLDRFSELGT